MNRLTFIRFCRPRLRHFDLLLPPGVHSIFGRTADMFTIYFVFLHDAVPVQFTARAVVLLRYLPDLLLIFHGGRPSAGEFTVMTFAQHFHQASSVCYAIISGWLRIMTNIRHADCEEEEEIKANSSLPHLREAHDSVLG